MYSYVPTSTLINEWIAAVLIEEMSDEYSTRIQYTLQNRLILSEKQNLWVQYTVQYLYSARQLHP